MRALRSKLALAALAVCLPFTGDVCAATVPASTPPARAKAAAHKRKPPAAKEPEGPPQPVPIPQLTPEQMPANPPQVSYQNGQLTIQSQNSTLNDILSAVRQRTGTQIESPAGAGGQRVATRLGPASVRDVMAALLNGAGFDYVMLGSNQNPGGVDRVILTHKSNNGAMGAPSTAAQVMPQPQRNGPGMAAVPEQPAPDEEDMDQQTVDEGEAAQPDQGQPPLPEQQVPNTQPVVQPQNGQTGQQPGIEQQQLQMQQQQQLQQQLLQQQQQQQQANPDGSNPNQPQVKTPDQLLQELQRMQQQQQQQQQQQPPE